MLPKSIQIMLFVALTSCGARDNASNAPDPAAPPAKLSLTSDDFKDGQPIPTHFSCDGANQAPVIRWGEPPKGTKGFALAIDDPDAPSGTFRHWGVFDIPASARSIGGRQRAGTEVNNDKGTLGYTGPCPPRGTGMHHYHFRLFALDTDKLDVGGDKVADVESAARKHALAQGELIGTYERR